jgi:two-component system, OmpR family, response regulator
LQCGGIRFDGRKAGLVTRVLVIDDEGPIRLICRVNLEMEGMEVLEAEDGAAGLELAFVQGPDIVLLDLFLPRLDGWQVAAAMLADERTRAVPIVVLTGRAEVRDLARGLEIGGFGFVTKPFDPRELAGLVRELVAEGARGEPDARRAEKLAELRSLVGSG